MTVRDLLREEFLRSGPIPFERFMEVALYAPGCGYYTAPADPFGKAGDFYTAEQLQPVFGRLIAQYARARFTEMGEPSDFRFVEIGAGRRELSEYLEEWNYAGVDAGEEFPCGVTGIVFANEFFDALPVHLAVKRAGGFVEQYVSESLQLVDGPAVSGRLRAYLDRYHPDAPEGSVVEVNLRALDWICRIAASMRSGLFVIIDYGYTSREWVRHSQGTLMSYRRHRASEDVLSNPGGGRHHVSCCMDSARGCRDHVWMAAYVVREPRVVSAACRRGRRIRVGAGRVRRARSHASPATVENAAVRNGRDVSGSDAAERRAEIKTAPISRGLVEKSVCYLSPLGALNVTSSFSERPSSSQGPWQLSWLRSSSVDSPLTSNLRISTRAQCDSYIRSFRTKVKKKVASMVQTDRDVLR